jgi:hypothetical protein
MIKLIRTVVIAVPEGNTVSLDAAKEEQLIAKGYAEAATKKGGKPKPSENQQGTGPEETKE